MVENLQGKDHMQAYWQRRIHTPRMLSFLLNLANSFFQVRAVFEPVSVAHFWISVGYNINSLLILLFLVPSFVNSKYNRFVRFGFMLCCIRQLVYVYNPAGLRDDRDWTHWMIFVMAHMIVVTLMATIHFNNFDNTEQGHLIFSLILINGIVFGLFASIFGIQSFLENQDAPSLLFIMLAGMGLTVFVIRSETAHQEHLDKIFKHISDQNFLKLILDTHNHALIVMNNQCQITFSNNVFKQLFGRQIEYAMASSVSEVMSAASNGLDRSLFDSDPSVKQSFRRVFRTILRRLSRKCNCFRKRRVKRTEAITDELSTIHIFGKTAEEQANFIAQFYSQPMFKQADQQVSGEETKDCALCFQDIYYNTDAAQEVVYELLDPTDQITKKGRGPLSVIQNSALLVKKLEAKRYIKFQFTQLTFQDDERLMIQIVDVSDSKLQQQFREQNEMLSILNATVSHELRNPLNSIVGQNVLKEALYRKLRAMGEVQKTSECVCCAEMLPEFKEILQKLDEGLRIQDSSARIMSFLVQDFLDYSQIKQGKFRINTKQFNVLETVEKVMSIQRDKANELGIDFTIEAPKLIGPFPALRRLSSGLRNDDSRVSQLVFTDEERFMQVLLNLQSNALKFTRKGSVTISIDVEPQGEEKFLKVSVTDTGIGIPIEDQDKLFKLFGFVQSTAAFNKNGIGLGLVISQKIVKKLGGQISFSSIPYPQPGHGATFSFSFKLEKPEMSGRAGHVDEMQVENAYSLNSKVLVYDYKVPEEMLLIQKSLPKKKPSLLRFADQDSSLVDVFSQRSFIKEEASATVPRTLRHADHFKFTNYSSSVTPNIQRPAKQLEMILGLSQQESSPSPQTLSTQKLHDPVPSSSTQRQEFEPLKQKKILIVDDQIFNVQALKAVLEYKFNVSESLIDYDLNGQEALERITKDFEHYRGTAEVHRGLKKFDPSLVPSSYCLILMDCNMPFLDGYECSRQIRELFASSLGLDTIQQPIISAVTGHAEEKYIQKCFSHGMNQVLSKPVQASALLAACVEAQITSFKEVERYNNFKK